MGPNVLLIVLDAARRDAFEPYGAPAGSSPTASQLAARGAALPEVHATAPWTVPSHTSMFTGLLPRAAGLSRVPSAAAAKAVLEPQAERFLPEVLRRSGYETFGVSSNPWASALSGLATGFDDFVSVRSERTAHIYWERRRGQLRWIVEAVRGRVDDGARRAREALEPRLAAASRRPFFWFVNLVECHTPYLPPRPYGNASSLLRARAAGDAREYFTLEPTYRINGGALEVPQAVFERARRLYRGAIRYMDDWVGELLERLDGAGVLDDTTVIVTADHGENLGEGGLAAHMLSLDQRLIHVPFVVAGPGAERFRMTSLAELPRCVAEVAGVADHPWHDGPPAGVGVAQSDPIPDAFDRRVFDDVGLAPSERMTASLSCAVRGSLKLVRRDHHEELVYDLAADPLELDPLLPERVDVTRAGDLADLRAALDHPSMAAAERITAAAPAPPPSPDEVRDLEERMKLLGYM